MLNCKAAFLRRIAGSVGLMLLTVSAAHAQVSATFYHIPVDAAAPPYASAFSSTPYCSTNVLGLPTGFNLDFSDLATRTAISAACPGTTASDFEHNFSIHFSGSLTAASSGTYSTFINSDDGEVFSVNGITYSSSWVEQAGGPGNIGGISLNAGTNPFLLDYFENSFGGAFVTLQVQDGVVVQPSAVPEPASVLLLGTGLMGIAMIARRRQTR